MRGLAPLQFAATVLTHLDETDRLGGVLAVIMRTGPLSYVGRGSGVASGLEPADPRALAALLVP